MRYCEPSPGPAITATLFSGHSRVESRPARAPVPLLVPLFLARTRPFLCPRRSMRRSTSEPAAPTMASAAGSTAGLPVEEPPAATAILHGLARRTAPQPQPPRSGSRASRWVAQERPQREAGARVTECSDGRRCGLPPPGIPRRPGYGFGPAASPALSPALSPAATVLLPSGRISSRAQGSTTGHAGRRWCGLPSRPSVLAFRSTPDAR